MTVEVVDEGGAEQTTHAFAQKLAEGMMSLVGCFFEVADGEFAGGVGSVIPVGVDDGLFSSNVGVGTLVAVILPSDRAGGDGRLRPPPESDWSRTRGAASRARTPPGDRLRRVRLTTSR